MNCQSCQEGENKCTYDSCQKQIFDSSKTLSVNIITYIHIQCFSRNMNNPFLPMYKKTFQMWKRENMSSKICHLKIINGFPSVINLSFSLLQPTRLQSYYYIVQPRPTKHAHSLLRAVFCKLNKANGWILQLEKYTSSLNDS